MNHQPFETWLLTDDPLAPEEHTSLQRHLDTCEDCRALASAWNEVDALMSAAPIPHPAPGFASRWQERLHARQAGRDWQKAWLLVLLNVGGMLVITGIFLSFLLMALQSPLDWVIAVTHQAMRLFALLKAIGDTTLAILALFPPAWWLGILETLAACSLLWIFSLRKFIPLRRVSQ